MLPRLTSARALAALFVFGYHLNGFGPLRFGYTGVGWFFVLSGFVLTWGWKPGRGAKHFWRRRFARIYPSHFVTLLAAIAVPVTTTTVAGGVLATLLLHPWDPQTQVAFGLNGVSWSLGCEAFFYALFPFVVTRVRAWTAAAYFLAASGVVILCEHLGGLWAVVGFANPAVRMGEFLLGVVAALALKDGRRVPPLVLAAAGAVSLAAMAALPDGKPLPDIWLAPLFLALIVWCAQRDLSTEAGLMTRRWFVYAGEVSYCFYLVHLLVLQTFRHYAAQSLVVDVLVLLTSVALAIGLHHLVELPAQRRILKGRPASRAAALNPAPVDA